MTTEQTTPPTPDAGMTTAVLYEFDLFVCDDGKGACDHYDCTGERKMAAEIIRLRAQLAAANADGAILDRVQDNLAVMNLSGEISDAIYEKFYEAIPHERWEQWNSARTGTR